MEVLQTLEKNSETRSSINQNGRGMKMTGNLPKDPMLLLSVINTKLRDFYKNLDLLCEDMDVEKDEIINVLSQIDYEYDEELNKFV